MNTVCLDGSTITSQIVVLTPSQIYVAGRRLNTALISSAFITRA